VSHPTPPGPDPLPSVQGARQPTRSAAAHRRAMQAAIANTVRAMRSTTGRRSAMPGHGRTPPPAGL
jgi:hypothetical protein